MIFGSRKPSSLNSMAKIEVWCRVMAFNASFNNISIMMEETGVPGENHGPASSCRQTLSHNVVSSAPRHEKDSNSQL
jgi:hypothetical protein